MADLTREEKIQLAREKQSQMLQALPREKKVELAKQKQAEALSKVESPEPDEILGVPVTTVEGALDSLPFAGALFGGAAGMAGGPLAAAGGAGLGAAGGEAAANAIRSVLGLESAPQTREEVYGKPIKEGAIGAAGEGAGQVLAKGAAKLFSRGAGRATDDVARQAEVIDPPQGAGEPGFFAEPKVNAPQIKQSAERIGGEATPGMLTDDIYVRNTENVLYQSPTRMGEGVRKQYEPIQKGLQRSAEDLAGAPGAVSKFEAGEAVKAGVAKKVKEGVEPLSTQFDQIRQSSRFIKPDPKSLNRSADRLLKQDLAEFPDLPQGQAISKYADMIRNAKSLDSLKQLRSSVGDDMSKALDAGDGQLAMALGKVKGAIQRVERREILKSAIEAMPTKKAGEKAAKELISEIKEVNKGWRSLMEGLEELGKAGGIKKIGSPKHLVRIIDDMPSEQLAQRFFNTRNFKGLQNIKKHLPEEFEVLRQAKLSEIAEKSMTKGQPDPVKLVRNIKKMGPEARNIVFGSRGEQVLKDMETVINSMPNKVGVSDTPRGITWFQAVLTPSNYGQEGASVVRRMLRSARTLENQTTQGLAKTLPRAAGYGAASTTSTGERRGEDKWAYRGLQKLKNHPRAESLSGLSDDLLQNPRAKRLLIQASDLKPGSKAMGRIMERIEALEGGK